MAAPPPTTEVEMVNLGLARIGQQPINSIEAPDTWVEDLCALHYPMTRRRLLRGPRVYSFAKAQAQLTVDATVTPVFGFASAYRLPNDCLRVLTLGAVEENDPRLPDLYDLRGRHLFTNETDEDDSLNLTYVKDETLVALWDALFVNLYRLEFAKDIAYKFTLKQSLLDGLETELRDVRLEAGAVSGQENPPRRITRSKWLANRRSGGGRNNTRHSI